MALPNLDHWMLGSTALGALALLSYCWTRRQPGPTDPHKDRARGQDCDPPLIQKHSSFQSYTTTYATYPSIRTFHSAHSQAETLPQDCQPLPLLVFLHGLGGSLAQFAHIFASLVNVAPCLAIDLPGCGLSDFSSTAWEAYSIEAMAELIAHVVEKHKCTYGYKDVVLIGHSMGCAISALLASSSSPLPVRLENVKGMVAVCPKGTPPTANETWYFGKILSLPNAVLNIMRFYDRRGGINSPSVTRFVGEAAGPDLRRQQLHFNASFQTPVWKRMAWGCLPIYNKAGQAIGGIPGRSVWAGLKVPLFLITGQCDTVTKPQEVSNIVSFLSNDAASGATVTESHLLPAASLSGQGNTVGFQHPISNNPGFSPEPSTTERKSQYSVPIKTAILPAPAAHALLYDSATYRTLAGLIEDFLSRHVSHCLDLGWQLQQRATSGKWDVKNLKKWQGVTPVSEPIAGGIFRAIKTLREQDEDHTPSVFANIWQHKIYAVIDISHDSPVYDPKVLEQNGMVYHKFPNVSKIPPTAEEVRGFIDLVGRLRLEILSKMRTKIDSHNIPAIAVHCHYGFNRTGFFLVSYLIEREDFSVQAAIDEFARRRPPGIRHAHFIDALFVRYCVGLGEAPILKPVEQRQIESDLERRAEHFMALKPKEAGQG